MEELREEAVRVKRRKKTVRAVGNIVLTGSRMGWSWWRRFLCL
jgi:hypothetical protein